MRTVELRQAGEVFSVRPIGFEGDVDSGGDSGSDTDVTLSPFEVDGLLLELWHAAEYAQLWELWALCDFLALGSPDEFDAGAFARLREEFRAWPRLGVRRVRVRHVADSTTNVDDLDLCAGDSGSRGTAGGSQAEEPAEHWITFQLLDDETEDPVAGANMRVTLSDGSVGTYTTDANGVVHIANVPPGPCDLEQIDAEQYVEIVRFA